MRDMFEALLDCRPVPPRRSLASSGSLLLHAAILMGLVAGSYLHVETMAGPVPRIHPGDRILRIELPGAAAAARSAGPSGASAAKAIKPEPTPLKIPDVVQPQSIPQETPEAEATRSDGGMDGVEGGLADGVPGGIVGGVPGGTPGGIPGGDPWGIPGSALTGLPAQDQPIYLIGEVRPPIRTTFVKPDYPDVARRARVTGTVVLEIVVSRTGDVEDIKVVRSDPLFDEAAIEAVRQWKYKPALQAGRPVKVYLTVRVEFGLV